MLLAFVASGLIHECMFWYAEGRVTGHWLTFFSVQARASAAPASFGSRLCLHVSSRLNLRQRGTDCHDSVAEHSSDHQSRCERTRFEDGSKLAVCRPTMMM